MNKMRSYLLPRVKTAQGRMQLPGSKSISNRALLLAAMAQGRTELQGVLESDDTEVMLDSLQRLGVAARRLEPSTYEIVGGWEQLSPQAELFLRNAGTAMRSLTAALAWADGDYQLSGIERMHERPIGDLVSALQAGGAQIKYLGADDYPPLHIKPASIDADHVFQVKGNVSSQFLTALLMSAPLVSQKTRRPVQIEVLGRLISQPYIAITLAMMADFGVEVEHEDWQRFVVPAQAHYRSPGRYYVEGDASSASYFLALGAIGGGPIQIDGVGSSSVQGDVQFAQVVEAMGAQVKFQPQGMVVQGIEVAQGQRLHAFDLSFDLIPDAAMTAAALAMYADGPCLLRDIGSWRVKETDRIHAMETELQRLGARVESGPDWLRVYPISQGQWQDAEIFTYDDHRIAMCFSLAAFAPVQVKILDPDCVSKTFPHYFSVFEQLVQT
ncbi:MAG TPA: 3-phosphoshikimate 1-carboxyvinyltransferase [Paenalcaligenes sp.]|nr:3-phosphoshikimate 1-carboxyvinyltransferase [Paenalcaligenes sp.]